MRSVGRYFSSLSTGMMIEIFGLVSGILALNYNLCWVLGEELGYDNFMKLVVGLGNPGDKYKNNRHNVGHLLVDELVKTYGEVVWESKFESEMMKVPGIIFLKPMTFMNRSGEAVSEVVNFYKISVDDLYLIHDDLDIRLGEYKIQNAIGPKVHNGVNSIESSLGKSDFWRVRVGVDNRPTGEARTPGETYVLDDFTQSEMESLKLVSQKIIAELTELLK